MCGPRLCQHQPVEHFTILRGLHQWLGSMVAGQENMKRSDEMELTVPQSKKKKRRRRAANTFPAWVTGLTKSTNTLMTTKRHMWHGLRVHVIFDSPPWKRQQPPQWWSHFDNRQQAPTVIERKKHTDKSKGGSTPSCTWGVLKPSTEMARSLKGAVNGPSPEPLYSHQSIFVLPLLHKLVSFCCYSHHPLFHGWWWPIYRS